MAGEKYLTSHQPITNFLNTVHDKFSYSLVSFADRLDYFLSKENVDEENNATRAYLSIGIKTDKENDVVFLSDTRVRLVLPGLENRLHVIFDDAFENDDPDEISSIIQSAEKSTPSAGLRYILLKGLRERIQTDIGIRRGNPVQFFGRARGKIIFPIGQWELRFYQTIMWLTEDRWEETTEMRWDFSLPDNYLFRSETRLKWEEMKNGTTPSHSFILYKEINPRSVWDIDLSGKWPQTPHTDEAEYVVSVTYRRLIYSKWLFLDISPGISFAQIYNYNENPFIILKLEFAFGNL